MNLFSNKTLFAAVAAAAAFMPLNTVWAQGAAKVEIQKPKFDDLPSPEYSGGKQKSFRPKNWLEIEVPLKVQLAPEPPSKTADEITVKWYVAVKNPDGRGTLLLSKEVQHVNVPLNEEVFASIYLSPASIRRLTGSDRAGKGAVDIVGIEVFVNGKKQAAETTKGKIDWWATASPNLSRSEAVPLLNKSETPFADMWWDRYIEVKVDRRN